MEELRKTHGSCSLSVPGELKARALKRNVFNSKMWREEKNVNI